MSFQTIDLGDATWAGGSGDLGSNWIIGYVESVSPAGSRSFVNWIYGAPTTAQDGDFDLSITTLNTTANVGAGGTLTGTLVAGGIGLDNGSDYVLIGSLAAPSISVYSGQLDLSGTGSVINTGSLEVGDQGILAVVNDGSVSVTELFEIGSGSGVGAEVSVSGTGSALNDQTTLLVNGGTLAITDGGTVSTGAIDAGFLGAGPATITVDGTGSVLQASNGNIALLLGTLAVSGGAIVSAQTIISRGSLALSDGAALIATGSIDLESYPFSGPVGNDSTLYGNGVIVGSVENNSSIIASGGTLAISGSLSGTGVATISPGLSDLALYGPVSAEQTVEFSGGGGGGAFIGGVLTLGDFAGFAGTIDNFQPGDTIDLQGITANQASFQEGVFVNATTYDSNVGLLTLSDATYGGGTAPTPVGSIYFAGLTANQTFALSSDGNGGTDITYGVSAPTLAVLADLDDATYLQQTYTGPGLSVDGYSVVDGASDSYGMLADAFQDGNQIVVAIRGTFPYLTPQLIKNLLSDASWISGKLNLPDSDDPDSYLQNEVLDAATFLNRVRQEFPTAALTITGHSLGGAVAQLLGLASGYTSIGFNAPGADQFYAPLENAGDLAAAENAGEGGQAGVNENFRMYGDQVSLAGVPIGPQYTLPQVNPDTWLNALANHSMDAIVATVHQNNITFTTGATAGIPDAPLPLPWLIQPTAVVVSVATTVLKFLFPVQTAIAVGVAEGVSAALNYLDPDGATSYQLIGDPGSPDFSDFEFPVYSGVASYNVSLLVDGSWQASQFVTPGMVVEAPSGDTGIEYSAVDENGNPVILPDSYIFGAAFGSTGTFSGTLTEDLACFAAGTRVLGPGGRSIPVEDLRPGDHLVTLDGELLPVIWMGYRQVDCHASPHPQLVRPVRILANAFGADLPRVDLMLSPDHAVFVDDVLIPVRYLLNGTTIRQEPIDCVTYWHVELDRHEIVFAEGLPCESFLDTGNRGAFANGEKVVQLHPNFTATTWEVEGRAPLVIVGPKLDAVRAKLRAFASVSQMRQESLVHSPGRM